MDYQQEVNFVLQEIKNEYHDSYHKMKVTLLSTYTTVIMLSSSSFTSTKKYLSLNNDDVSTTASTSTSITTATATTTAASARTGTTTYTIHEFNETILPSHCKGQNALSIFHNKEDIAVKGKVNDDINDDKNTNNCRRSIITSILTPDIKHEFQQNGIIILRGLLSNELFHGLNTSSHELVQEQIHKYGDVRSSTGKQFFMNKMGLVFTNDDDDDDRSDGDVSDGDSDSGITGNDNGGSNYQTTAATTTKTIPSSSYRNVALESLIPQIAAELLDLKHVDDDEQMNDETDATKEGHSTSRSNDNEENDYHHNHHDTLRMLR